MACTAITFFVGRVRKMRQSATVMKGEGTDKFMSKKLKDSRCKAQTRKVKPCRAAATAGGLCSFHANPNKASELGRIGGRRNRRQSAHDSLNPLPKLETATA